MRTPARQATTFRRVWTIPLVLAASTIFGLLAALLGTGIWHAGAWTALAAPVVVAAAFSMRPRRR
jgi:hypothetical protein